MGDRFQSAAVLIFVASTRFVRLTAVNPALESIRILLCVLWTFGTGALALGLWQAQQAAARNSAADQGGEPQAG